MRRSYTGEQHNPLSTIYRFAVLSQNDMFKYRQEGERKGGAGFPQCGGSNCTEPGKNMATFGLCQMQNAFP